MKYEFYTSSVQTWRAMFKAIEGAKESVYLETYIFLDDVHKMNFLELLEAKAREGLRVRLILDAFGSLSLPKKSVVALRESGAEIFFYSNLLHRIHRKILIIDERTAFIGGVNIHEVARRWVDLTILVRGKMANSILRSFAKVYAECGGRDPKILAEKKRIVLDKTRNWLVEHFPGRKSASLKKVYTAALRRADSSAVLVTPYLMPRRWFIRALHQAVLRGVKVDVLMPKVSNHLLGDTVGYFFMHKLSEFGVNFYLTPKMNHAKCMLIDEREGLVGSQNLDFLSFDFNLEAGVFLKDPVAVAELANIISKWQTEAELFDPVLYKAKTIDYFMAPLVRLFSRIF